MTSRVARFEPNGAPDVTFGTGGKASVGFSTGTDKAWSALIQSDGAIVVAGHAGVTSPLGPDNDFAVARFTPEGRLDTSFGDGGKVTSNIAGRTDLAVAAALQPDGKIVLAGRVTGTSVEDCGLARYTIEGKLDDDFGDGGIVRGHMSVTTFGDQVADVAIQGDGKILVAGSATTPSGATAGLSFGFALARFRSDGRPGRGLRRRRGRPDGLQHAGRFRSGPRALRRRQDRRGGRELQQAEFRLCRGALRDGRHAGLELW